MKITDKEIAKKDLDAKIESEKEKILKRLTKLIGLGQGSAQYHKRLDKIYNLIKEKLFVNGEYKQLLKSADMYQRIETFMDYETEKVETTTGVYKVITTDIDSIIGEVFKSLYINIILAYLDDEESFGIPYIGKLFVSQSKKYHPIFKKIVKSLRCKFNLDPDFRKDLHRIDREEKIEVIDTAIKSMKKTLYEKVF